ncbi:MAG: sulfatase-like hydrolase/transferase [Rubripirellula sp.]
MFTRLLTLVVVLVAFLPETQADERPNLIVVLCDDLGYGDLECYGHPHIKTPNLNALADSGIRFTDFYSTAPVCSPSRVGLLTGRSPNRAGVYDWIPEAGKPKSDGRERVHMRASETTIPQLLKQAGYQTCMAGKWHCNSEFNNDEQPQPGDFGFDHWLATQNNASPSHEHPTNFVRNGEPVGLIEDFSCQIVVDETLAWLEKANREQPFFIYAAFHEPHEPVASPSDLVDQYRDVSESEDQSQYFANVANVDAAVGKLVAGLVRLDRRENTLIVFTSDNGPETLKRYSRAARSHGRPGPLRGMKLHTTEAGFRVAGIMNWPGRIAAEKQVIATPVSALDFLPTFCELANAEISAELELDGTSFLPVLSGEPLPREKPLVWAYFNALNESRVAMRDGKWKVLARLNGGSVPKMQNVTRETLPTVRDAELTDIEIYNLEEDIHEANDLSEVEPALAKQLAEKLERHYRELVNHSHVW